MCTEFVDCIYWVLKLPPFSGLLYDDGTYEDITLDKLTKNIYNKEFEHKELLLVLASVLSEVTITDTP